MSTNRTKAGLPRLAAGIMAAAMGASLSGCGHSDAKAAVAPAPLTHVHVHGADALNPGEQGESLPVVVRVLELTEASAFGQATLRSLSADAKRVLGPTCLAEHEIVVYPGTEQVFSFPAKPKTKHIGFVALFRRGDPELSRVEFSALSTHVHLPLAGTSIGRAATQAEIMP